MRSVLFPLFLLTLVACGPEIRQSDLNAWQSSSQQEKSFPLVPHPVLTPGKTCKQADEYRHPEQIKYCLRDVTTWQKNAVIEKYDLRLNYTVARMNRQDFKVDHFIPLCLGGSNSPDNLWPQHRSLFLQTDSIEHKLCRLLQQGEISQSEAIELVKQSKRKIEKAAKIESYLDRLLAD